MVDSVSTKLDSLIYFVTQAIYGLSFAPTNQSDKGPPEANIHNVGEDNPTKGEKSSEKDAANTMQKDKRQNKSH